MWFSRRVYASDAYTDNTTPVDLKGVRQVKHHGRIEKVTYHTKDYTNGQNITKPAYVYLPYGYDHKKAYDILYIMHGWTMTAENFFYDEENIPAMFDYLIESKQTQPFIAVSLTFDAENKPQSFGRSVNELSVFHQELRKDVIPYIESRYHTYAEDISLTAIKASRAHRAFAGFSLGAVTTWYQFCYNLDLIKSFVPMSGDCWIIQTYGGLYRPKQTVDALEDVIAKGQYTKDDFYIYEGIGTSDPIFDQTDGQIQEMKRRKIFTPDNLHYGIKEGGYHDLVACREYLYNALPEIFSGDAQ